MHACCFSTIGLIPILPTTLTISPPTNSNSNLDQCNLIRGVYHCSYHPLFDCNPSVNQFYTWNTILTITAQFPVPVQMVNIITSRFTSTTVWVQILGRSFAVQRPIIVGSYNIYVISLPFEVDEINPLLISASSTLFVTNIIFCGRNGLYCL